MGGLSQPMLLLLDNFEHLVSAAPVVAQMLTSSPNSHGHEPTQRFQCGEHEFPVLPPLALPDPVPFRGSGGACPPSGDRACGMRRR